MASDLRCDDHPEHEAAFIIGNAQTGEQSFYCPECTGIFGLTMALAVLDPHDIAGAASERIKAAASNGQEVPAKPPARKRQKKAPAGKPGGAASVAGEGEKSPAPDGG